MNYELVKQLKDAGFKQNWKEGVWFQDGKMKEPWLYTETEYGYPVDPNTTRAVIIPTLSELIEACGEKFGALESVHRENPTRQFWRAITRDRGMVAGQLGDTPEEAVALLWLALNQ